MKLSTSDLAELADLAISAATEAGQMISQARPQAVEHKAGGDSLASQVVTEIDRRSEDIILEVLTPTLERFDLGLLAEEQDDNGTRFEADYFWCIDPLDGTLPFIEGTPGYAVSIALVGRDGTPWIGVIFDPVEATLYHAIRGGGAFRNREPWIIDPQMRGEVLSVFADRSFVTAHDHDAVLEDLERIANDMDLRGVQLHTTGGAVMNACNLLANGPACYFKSPKPAGGGSLWDFAATACLAQELGAVATDIHGASLDLNRPDSTFMNHRGVLFATDEVLAQRLRAMHQSRSGDSEQPSTETAAKTVAVHNQHDEFDLYIGRAVPEAGLKASKWGNPFVMADDSDAERDRAIADFRAWIVQQPELVAALPELWGLRLGCWCAPKPCHGDVLAELAEACR